MLTFTLSLFCLALTAHRAAASSLALYSDANCTNADVLENVAALNGYPDGQCTHISDLNDGDSYGGLMFLTLDAGCAITLYGEDSVVCSGSTFLASLNVCYNTSWTYYSVDGCTAPSISASSSDETSTASSGQTTVTVSASASASTSSGAASSSSSSSSSPSLSGGAIAGIVIVAIAAVAGVAVAGIYFLGRRRASDAAARTQRREQIEESKGEGDGWQQLDSAGAGVPRQFGSLGMTPLPQRTGPYPMHEVGGQERVEVEGQGGGRGIMGELPERPFR